MNAWRRWVAWCGRDEDARGQAWARTRACLIAAAIAANVGRLGRVDTVYREPVDGGIAVQIGATPDWLTPGEWPALYRCVADPLDGRLEPEAAARWMPLWVWGGRATVALELASPLLLTRWAPWWALFGAAMHVGIAAMTDLAWFPYGMLALYPLLFQRWLEPGYGASSISSR